MPEQTLKIGGYLSTITEYLGNHEPRSTESNDSLTDDSLGSLEELLNERIGLSPEERSKSAGSEAGASEEVPARVDKRAVVGAPAAASRVNQTEAERNQSGSTDVELLEVVHSLLVDGPSVEEILGSRQASLDSWTSSSATCAQPDRTETGALQTALDTLVAGGAVAYEYHDCSSIDENDCPICNNEVKTVHFHDDMNVTHTISIESGNFLTPLPKRESKTDISTLKHDKHEKHHKHKEESDKPREKKLKKHNKNSNKPDESQPTN